MRVWTAALALLAVMVAVAGQGSAGAHVTVVSPFTYHRDIAPILERRCASCHSEGGVGPQAFGSYQDARAQAVAMRRSIMSGQMPPWSGQSHMTALKEQSSLTTRELDMLMTWSAGGTPEGAFVERAPVPSSPPAAPDAVIAFPEPFILRGDVLEADHEVEVPAASLAGQWIRAATLIPEHPAIVRRAEIAIRSQLGEQVVGLWLPGEGAQGVEGNGAFLMPADGRLRVRVHYKHPRPLEALDRSDRSRIGIYLAPATSAPIRSTPIGVGRSVLRRGTTAVAFRVVDAPPGAEVTVDVTEPGKGRSMLLRFKHRLEWQRRYIFVDPIALSSSATIDVRVVTPARFSDFLFRAVLETVE